MASKKSRRPRGIFQVFEADVSEARDTDRALDYVADTLENPDEAMTAVLRMMEADEREHFGKMKGRYVRTGRTISSLTKPKAPNAIRRVHNGKLVFGSSVWYSHFLTKSPYDVENHQVRKGRKGEGRSAVLVLKPTTGKRLAELMLTSALAKTDHPEA